MKKLWQFLVGTGVLMVLLAFVAACSFPSIGSGTGSGSGADGGGEEEDMITGPANTDGAETILINGGTFRMGSEDTDSLADEDELPSHEVTLSAFYIYTHEVTNGMYAECVTAGRCNGIEVHETGPTLHYGDPAYDEFPVVGVDWNMASAYCAWANARLPTEAEWELAARGTESLVYPWGSETPGCDRVNMLGCLVPPDALVVGSLSMGNSPYGLWDMSGNVWEWVQDWYDADYYFLSPQDNPIGPYTGETKVARGGGLKSEPVQMRAATRVGGNPYRSYDDVGFRCVVADLTLPEAYVPPLDRHEMVPPDPLDPGADIEDPDEPHHAWLGTAVASCPDTEGGIQIIIGAGFSEPMEFSVVVNGNPFDCYYDEMLEILVCEGPIPENNDELEFYFVEVSIEGHPFPALAADRPVDCDEPEALMLPMLGTASCPKDGLIKVTFEYDIPITWDATQLDGVGVPCLVLADTQLDCVVPERPAGDHYDFYLHGTDTDGLAHEWYTLVVVPGDCPVGMRSLHVDPMCFEDHPVAVVSYLPTDLEPESILIDGVLPDSCIGMAMGVQYCGDLPGPPGAEAVVSVCFPGEECIDHTITVPACPGTQPEFRFSIESGCYPILGPVVIITYFPADQALVAANANGADLTCVPVPGGMYMCYTLPGSTGSEMTISFCLEDGSCHSQAITVLDCEQGGQEPSAGDWRIATIGCENDIPIFFTIDTGLAWLVPGASFTYTAADEESSYSCSVPTIAGRLFCFGEKPGDPGTLQVCVQQDGAPSPTCQSFPDWPIYVAGITQCTIPAEPVEPVTPPFDCTAAYGASSALCDPTRCTFDPVKKICVNR